MRLLASLSQFTGNGKYIHAAGEATEYMFQQLLVSRKWRSALGRARLC